MRSLARRSKMVLVLPFAALTLACGGDGATAPEATLTTAEFQDMTSALPLDALSIALGALGGSSVRSADAKLVAPGGDSPAFTESIDEVIDCYEGTTRIRGSYTVNETTGAVSVDLRQSFTNCVSFGGTTDREYTFNGDPDLRTVLAVTAAGAATLSMSGAFKFTSSGPSGRCTVNFQVNLSAGTATGTICGKSAANFIEL